jgi:hypothetical protein
LFCSGLNSSTTSTAFGGRMTALIIDPLSHVQSLSQHLFLSLSPTQTKPPPSPSIQSLVQADADLAAGIRLAHIHQSKQRRMSLLKEDVLRLDEAWKIICQDLETGRKELEAMIQQCEERIKAIESAKEGPFPRLWRISNLLSLSYSVNTVSGTSCVRTESKCVHLRTTQYARSFVTWSTTSPSILPTLSQRGKNAARKTQRRSTVGLAWGDPFRWQT